MVNYRRLRIAGATYFLTVTLRNRKSKILTQYIELLYHSIKQVKLNHPFKIHAMVILPEHFHALWQLPENDDNYSMRLRQIKSLFTKKLISINYSLTKNHRGEYNVWQRRFYEHTIRNEDDFQRHFDYIHFNPIKHDLVQNIQDWPYSTFHLYNT